MASFDKCPRCKQYGWAPCACTCFSVRFEGEEDKREVWALTAERAAEQAIQSEDASEWEYPIASADGDETRIVFVGQGPFPPDGRDKVFRVRGNFNPVYHAETVENYEPDPDEFYGRDEKKLLEEGVLSP